VGEIDPVALEDVLHLELEDFRVGKDISGDPIGPHFGIVFQHRSERLLNRILHPFPSGAAPIRYFAAVTRERTSPFAVEPVLC
jgi:hypothetical protein